MKKRFSTVSSQSIKTIGSILVYVLILAGLFVYARYDSTQTKEAVFGSVNSLYVSDIVLEYGGETYYYRENEITNYLLIGLDQDSVTQTGGYQHGGQADFLVVLSIDRLNRTITPLMLDRDTMTQVQTYGVFGHPSGKRVMQLCLAQAYSGRKSTGSHNTAQAVENLLHGVKIDRYVTIDISAVPLLNDTVGGVEVTLFDDFTVFDPAMTQGSTIRLMGEQTEFFVRGRMTVADGSNVSRMARQQQYISGFLTQLRQKMETEPDILFQLWESAVGHIQSDTPPEILMRETDAYAHYEWMPLRTLSGTHSIDEYRFAEFRVDEDSLRELVTEIWFIKEEQK